MKGDFTSKAGMNRPESRQDRFRDGNGSALDLEAVTEYQNNRGPVPRLLHASQRNAWGRGPIKWRITKHKTELRTLTSHAIGSFDVGGSFVGATKRPGQRARRSRSRARTTQATPPIPSGRARGPDGDQYGKRPESTRRDANASGYVERGALVLFRALHTHSGRKTGRTGFV